MHEKSGWCTSVAITPTGCPAVSIAAITAVWDVEAAGHVWLSLATGGETVHLPPTRSAKLAPPQASGATAAPVGASAMPLPKVGEQLGASGCSAAASAEPPAGKSRTTVSGLTS